MSYEKPLPVLDPESTPFWEATREHKLKIVKCGDCGQVRFPPTSFCPHCSSSKIEWIEASGKAKVFSWIVVRHPVPKDFVPASGVLARAEKATAEKGQWLMDDHVELITRAIENEFGRTKRK